jgi:hypothetical protein
MVDKLTLSPRERDMAILRIGWLNQAPYEFEQHERIAKGLGFSADEIDRVTKGPRAEWNERDAALLQAAADLFENSVVSDETWKKVVLALQRRTDDGPGFHDRAVQSGVMGAQLPRRSTRRLLVTWPIVPERSGISNNNIAFQRQDVSGNATISTTITSKVSWIDVYIEGVYFASSPPYTFTWNSGTVANGGPNDFGYGLQ